MEGQITTHQCCVNKLGASEDVVNCLIHDSQSLQDPNVEVHPELVRWVDCVHSLLNKFLGVWWGQRVYFLEHVVCLNR